MIQFPRFERRRESPHLLFIVICLFTPAVSLLHCPILRAQSGVEPTSTINFKAFELAKWDSILLYKLPEQIEGFPTISRVRIKNVTETTWVGLEAKGSCGCVAVTKLDAIEVPPGESFDLEFSTTPSAERAFKQQINIQARDKDGHSRRPLLALQVTSTVSPPVEVTPKAFKIEDLVEGKCKIRIRSGAQDKISVDWGSVAPASDDISLKFDKNSNHETMLVRVCDITLKDTKFADPKRDLLSGIYVAFRLKGSEERYVSAIPLEFLAESPVRIIPRSHYIERTEESKETLIDFAITDRRERDVALRPESISVRLVRQGGNEKDSKITNVNDVKLIQRSKQFLTGSLVLPGNFPELDENTSCFLEIYEESGLGEPELIGRIVLLRK